MQRPRTPLGLLLGLVLLCGGCLNLDPRANPTQFYVLGGAWEEPAAGPAEGLAIGLRELSLAAYLETPLIVTRAGAHTVRFAEYHRWGEDLGRGINRTVAAYLAAQPGVQRVDVVPWPRYVEHDVVVELRVLRFEGVLEGAPAADGEAPPRAGTAHLLAEWTVLGADGDAVLARGTTALSEGSWTEGDYDALVARLDAALGMLAADVLAAIGGRPNP